MLISLCLITGNAEEYIERCLESFIPIFKNKGGIVQGEICLVRAIGSLKPDSTFEKFSALAGLHAGLKVKWAEYKNAADNALWPHLDDFAAARNLSFSLATGEFIFWCDTDDVLLSDPKIVRELVEHHSKTDPPADCFICPYEIFGQHVTVPRERIVRRGMGKWNFPVHECFHFSKDANAFGADKIVVRHIPHTNKKGSVERNLRIMEGIPEEEMTPGMRYHKHCELIGAGRKAEATEAAIDALKKDGLGRPERYQLMIHLATFAKDPHVSESYLHAAYQCDPCRREALGLLSGHMIDYGEPEKAIAYARQMIATLPPKDESWNDRRSLYGWVGDHIYEQALRFAGYHIEAETLRIDALKRGGGPIISLIHATRGRPKKAASMRKLWMDLAEKPEAIEHIFCIDEDDEASRPLTRMHHTTISAGRGCVEAWNIGAGCAQGRVLIQMSDDWLPPPRWDIEILNRLGGPDLPRVLAISDGYRTDKLLCMAIMTRTYYMQDWFMFHPDFLSMYSDNYFTDVAYERGQVIEARDLVFKHDHPVFTGAQMDQTYIDQNSQERYLQGEQVYSELKKGRDWSQIPGYFNFWPFYRKVAETLQDGDTVAEIGVWFGRSIIYLAQQCARLGKTVKLIAVDTFKGDLNQPEHQKIMAQYGGDICMEFCNNLHRCGVYDMVQTYAGESVTMAEMIEDKSLAFCFIDAAHDYESVRADIEAWLPKIKPGGTMAGHDADWPDVKKAVNEAFPEAIRFGPVWMSKKLV